MLNRPDLSIVIPCYNEDEVLPLLKIRLCQCLDKMGLKWEVIFIDDGSSDQTYLRLLAINREDPRFKVLAFSRNFGHQMAILAGLHYARGIDVAIMDADLQDPPEILSRCLEKLHQGYDVVYAVRRQRADNVVKRASAFLFYRFLKLLSDTDIPVDTGDFCVMNRRVVAILKQMPERNLFLRGLRAWAGFRQIGLEFERGARAAGRTKYSFIKMLRLAFNGILGFSILPLRMAVYLGLATMFFSGFAGLLTFGCRMVGFRFMGHTASEFPIWATMECGVFFFSGIQLLFLGCIGEYIGRIYNEIRQRPRWIVSEELGFDEPSLSTEEKSS